MYQATVIQIDNLRPHSNADRLQLTTIHGNQVIVSIDNKIGDVGIYFPTDGQLSEEYCKHNNLYQDSKLNKDETKKGYLSLKRRVQAKNFRGERSEGLFMPLESLSYLGHTLPILGMEFTESKGKFICNKYVNPQTLLERSKKEKKIKTKKIQNDMFKQHIDTSQFGRNAHKYRLGDTVIVTEKLHGTSQRVGRVLTSRELRWYDKLLMYFGILISKNIWKTLIGTRRVILGQRKTSIDNWVSFRYETKKRLVNEFLGYNLKENDVELYRKIFDEENTRQVKYQDINKLLPGFTKFLKTNNKGFYSDQFREEASKYFMKNLRKGETVYYEVVGYESLDRPIMGTHSNSKLKGHLSSKEYKKFIKDFGDNTIFNYNCNNGEHSIYVYRITMTNEDNISVDYSWNAVKERCAELGVNTVPELCTIFITDTRDFQDQVKLLANSKSEIFTNHVREGVCIRKEGILPIITKEKAFNFKVLEGIIKESNFVDTEESEDV